MNKSLYALYMVYMTIKRSTAIGSIAYMYIKYYDIYHLQFFYV